MSHHLVSTSNPFASVAPATPLLPIESSRGAHDLFLDFVAGEGFPCVGARSALNRGRYRFGSYEALADAASVAAMHADLVAFGREYPDPGLDPVSFIGTFRACEPDEAAFEHRLWRHLQALHEADRDFEWCSDVDADPASPRFSFSVGGRAFFVVGLHPQSSRLARRAPMCTLVFNFHAQFEAMRHSGRYAKLQTAIRTRDIAIQGGINPVLAQYGDASEARQYSGRATAEGWECPFKSMKANA